MDTEELEARLLDARLLRNGHYRLSSGKHADRYLNLRVALADAPFGAIFADQLRTEVAARAADGPRPLLLAVSVGGILLADRAARRPGDRHLGMPEERWDPSDRPIWLVDDVLTDRGEFERLLRAPTMPPITTIYTAASFLRDEVVGGAEVLTGLQLTRQVWSSDECSACAHGPPTDMSDAETAPLVTCLHDAGRPAADGDLAKRRQAVFDRLRAYDRAYRVSGNTAGHRAVAASRALVEVITLGMPVHLALEAADVHLVVDAIAHHLHTQSSGWGDEERARRDASAVVGALLGLAQLRIEYRPVGVGVVMTKGEPPGTTLSGSLQLEGRRTLHEWKELRHFFDVADESAFVLHVGPDAEIIRVREPVDPSPSWMDMDHPQAAGTVGLLLARGSGAIDVYLGGTLRWTLQLSETEGRWRQANPGSVFDQLRGWLGEPHVELVQQAWHVSRQMVRAKSGGILILDAEDPASVKGNGSASGFPCPPLKLEQPKHHTLLAALAEVDGALVFDRTGVLQRYGVILSTDTARVDGSGEDPVGGSRTQAARHAARTYDGTIVVCVSQNGAIRLFHKSEMIELSAPHRIN